MRRIPLTTITLSLALFCGLLGTLHGRPTSAQSGTTQSTPTPTPESEELRRLRDRNAIMEEKKKAILLENQIRDAQFPAPSTTPLKGETTISDGAVIESQSVSYAALARAADVMVSQFKSLPCTKNPTSQSAPCAPPPPITQLAIYDGNEINLLAGYGIAKERARLMGEEYKKILAPLPTPTPTPTPPDPVLLSTLGSGVAPFSIARSFLGAIVDMTALLRTNVEIKGASFQLEKESLVSEVFRAAKEKQLGAELYYPAQFPIKIDVNTKYELLETLEQLHATQGVAAQLVVDWVENEKTLDEITGVEKSLLAAKKDVQAQAEAQKGRLKKMHFNVCPGQAGLYPNKIEPVEDQLANLTGESREQAEEKLRSLRRQNCRLWSVENEMQIEDLETLFAALKTKETDLAGKLNTANSDLSTLRKRREQLRQKLLKNWQTDLGTDEAMGRLKTLNDQFDQFVGALALVDGTTGVNLLTSYLKTERMSMELKEEGCYWLQLQVVKAGGNNRIKTNLLVDIFTGGQRVSHSGGAIVQYVLYSKDGKAVAADTIPAYTGYIKSKKVETLIK